MTKEERERLRALWTQVLENHIKPGKEDDKGYLSYKNTTKFQICGSCTDVKGVLRVL